MRLVFANEPIAPCWEEFLALARQHHAGTVGYRRHEPLALSRERYQSANESGFLYFLTARDAGRLVGYLIIYRTLSMHSQLSLVIEDTFFLHPDHRGGRNAIRFIQYMEALCRTWGIHELMCSCEIDNASGIRRLLSFLDYQEVVVSYSKHLSPSVGADSSANAVLEAFNVRTS